ncbi:MAG: sensor histidine kinase, partial [Microbacterium sp.]|nr:sensor histidine kinase [Microbacterium sp.]
MFRPVSRTWLALDIVGAVIGFGLTVGIPLVPGSGGLSVWIVDGGWSVTAYLVVGAIVWGAAAIARLAPALALCVAWFGALLQMAAGLPPVPFDFGVLVVLFATAAWGSRRLLWLGGASALGGGIVGGAYFGLAWSGELITDAASVMRAALTSVLLGSLFVLAMVMAWGAGLLWRVILAGRATQVARAQAETVAAEEQERVRI